MNELMTKEIFERIDLLAAKIGTTAETVWPWFVKQQYIEAGVALLIFVPCLISSIFLGLFVIKHYKDEVKTNDLCSEIICIFICVAAAISGLGLIIGLIGVLKEVPDIFNAEMWALKDLINSIR